ncbi:formate dehydrogenase accessory sulfurtransferase FdhD [Streptomyces aidingensis]|uniref:Sulfur carrier protein FdhD n=1 Tax=Streptomyces aidingensis TaxID=910347 RepID=A0A1I1JAB9_9ACTN|nr:formate dehydrogenase accessory sulfurtransferase FdhD [Streptomyces aidingensis]SFC42883.1 FdhD protein [Streptomyces aidingensis]
MGRITEKRRILRIRDGAVTARTDTLAGEEPLEIRLNGRRLAVTMRTPGDDFALAAGFLVSEGVLGRPEELTRITYCSGTDDSGANTYNVVDVRLAEGVPLPEFSLERNVYTTSSCGVCGKAALEAVRTTSRWPLPGPAEAAAAAEAAGPGPRLTPELLAGLPGRLRGAQRVFDRTGGLHAAGLFAAGDGRLLDVREDVGRHNAVDKVIGRALHEGLLPLAGTVLAVSGRASFELAQKAVMAGIPVLAAVSAPSSLAVELAEETGLTLVGFLRGTSMNVYAGAHRLELPSSSAAAPAAAPSAAPSASSAPSSSAASA